LNAYVLVQTEPNRNSIAEALRAIPGVLFAEDITGAYDAIALARSDSTRSLSEQVVATIRQLPGVIRAISAPLIGSTRKVELAGTVEAA
jgi:DNA-binding Lrp family transcriptional regulator